VGDASPFGSAGLDLGEIIAQVVTKDEKDAFIKDFKNNQTETEKQKQWLKEEGLYTDPEPVVIKVEQAKAPEVTLPAPAAPAAVVPTAAPAAQEKAQDAISEAEAVKTVTVTNAKRAVVAGGLLGLLWWAVS
jgi:hypothetical protein